MNRTLRMWMIWVMAAVAPFFIFPSEAAVWDGPRSHPAAQKVEDAYVLSLIHISEPTRRS